MRLAWTDRALTRVRETARYIAADDPDAARRWADGLFDVVESQGATDWYIVEQESYPYPPLESARRCLQALKAMGK